MRRVRIALLLIVLVALLLRVVWQERERRILAGKNPTHMPVIVALRQAGIATNMFVHETTENRSWPEKMRAEVWCSGGVQVSVGEDGRIRELDATGEDARKLMSLVESADWSAILPLFNGPHVTLVRDSDQELPGILCWVRRQGEVAIVEDVVTVRSEIGDDMRVYLRNEVLQTNAYELGEFPVAIVADAAAVRPFLTQYESLLMGVRVVDAPRPVFRYDVLTNCTRLVVKRFQTTNMDVVMARRDGWTKLKNMPLKPHVLYEVPVLIRNATASDGAMARRFEPLCVYLDPLSHRPLICDSLPVWSDTRRRRMQEASDT